MAINYLSALFGAFVLLLWRAFGLLSVPFEQPLSFFESIFYSTY